MVFKTKAMVSKNMLNTILVLALCTSFKARYFSASWMLEVCYAP